MRLLAKTLRCVARGAIATRELPRVSNPGNHHAPMGATRIFSDNFLYGSNTLSQNLSFSSIYPVSTCSFHSGRDEDPEPQDMEILELLDTGRIDYKKVNDKFAELFHERSCELQLETFFSLVQKFRFHRDRKAVEVLQGFILGWMMKFHEQGRLDRPPRTELMGMSLQCFAKSHHPRAGELAEKFLNELEELVQQERLGFEVDAHKYSIAMKPFAARGNVDKAQAIFDRQMEEFEGGNESARPTCISWSTLIDAIAKSGKRNAGELALGKLREAQQSVEAGILKEPPDATFYATVINAFAKSKQPEEAEKMLEEMNTAYLSGNSNAQPGTNCFSQVLDGWSRTKTAHGAQRCEKILNRMVKLFEDGTLPVRPVTVSYSAVISAYGRVGLPRDASRILEKQHTDFLDGNHAAELDAQCFLGVLEGWFNSGESIAGEQAELILDRMDELHKQGRVKEKPDTFIYNAVMKAWGEVGEPLRAAKIFRRQRDDFENGNSAAKPSVFSYSILLDAFAKAKLPNAGELADGAFEHMKQMKVEPDLPVYSVAFKCWQCSKGHDPKVEERCRELDGHIRRLKKGTQRSRRRL